MTFLAREHYDASYYEPQVGRYLRRTRFTRHRLGNVFELLGEPPAGRRVLDLGCGMGTFTIEAARRGAAAVGMDPSEVALRSGRAVARELGVHSAFAAADAAHLPVRGGTIDAVICADLTEHLDDATLSSMLAEVARVLKPGGVVAVYTPAPGHLFERLKARNWLLRQDPSHIGLRPLGRLTDTLECAGLLVTRAYYRPTHLPVYNTIERLLAPLPLLGSLFRRRVCIAGVKPAAGSSADGGGERSRPWR